MQKLDLKRTRKDLFTAPLNRFVSIEAPAVTYLMADGHGDPNTVPEYRLAVESLYSTAYAIKFLCKAQGRDFVGVTSGEWRKGGKRRERHDEDAILTIRF